MEYRVVNKATYAELMMVNQSTVERWMAKGELEPAFRTPGGSPRFWFPPENAREPKKPSGVAS